MKMLVLGGGAAGMSAASKAKRENPDLEVIVIEAGNFVSYAECGIPYFLAGLIKSHEELIHYPLEEFTKKRKIEIITGRKVVEAKMESKCLILDNGEEMQYDILVIATGASARKNNFTDLENVYTVRSLDDAIRIKTEMKGENVAIVGDGVLGMELASELAEHGKKVFLYSKHNTIFPLFDGRVIEEALDSFKKLVHVTTGVSVKQIDTEHGMLRISLDNGDFSSHDHVIFATGLVPNTDFLKGSPISMNQQGLVMVNRYMESSIEGVYACGDCATSINRITGKSQWHPMAQVANKMGRVAGSNISGKKMTYLGALGTTLVKIMGYEIGFTGLTMENAKNEGFNPKEVFVKGGSRAKYYPGGSDIRLLMVYDADSGRILGAQISSGDGGAWRLNTIETAIYSGMDMETLFYNDLGYTPPFSQVWDPIVTAASLSMRD